APGRRTGGPGRLRLDAPGGLPVEGRPAHEVPRLVQLDDPPETGLVRVRRRVELVAVEGHPGLEPERVAGTEPDRGDALVLARFHQGIPELGGPGRVDEDLEAVLAGVAGAGDEGRDPGPGALGDRVVAEGIEIDVDQRPDDLDRARTLDRDEGRDERPVVEDGPEPLESLRQPGAYG